MFFGPATESDISEAVDAAINGELLIGLPVSNETLNALQRLAEAFPGVDNDLVTAVWTAWKEFN